jgi:hypothetical protein
MIFTHEQLELMRDHQTPATKNAIGLLLIESALWGESDLGEIETDFISEEERTALTDLYNDLLPTQP